MKTLTPEEMNRAPDVPKALKVTVVFAMSAAKAISNEILPKDILSGNTLNTFEGPRDLYAMDVVLFQRSKKGKYWAVDRKTFNSGFFPVKVDKNDPLLKEGWQSVMPKDYVRAWKVDEQFKVKVSWGEQESEKEGGMLVQKITDPSDYWICSFEDFKNYQTFTNGQKES